MIIIRNMVKTRLSRKKTNKGSLYKGVYASNNGWLVKLNKYNKKFTYGPFETEIDAVEAYKKYKCIDNSIKNENMKISQSQLHSQNDPKIFKRIKFSTSLKNKICAKQRWSCNYCKKILSDIFIIDHIIPLFLGGINHEYNLQSLCPSCERFKTSYLDHKVLIPLSKIKKLEINDVLKAQNDNYHKLMCLDPANSIKPVNNSNITTINCDQYTINNGIKTIELIINGETIKINI